MIEDIKTGKYKYVIVYMFDRFARNRLDSIMYNEILRKQGVRVISALEPVSDDEGGEFYENISNGARKNTAPNCQSASATVLILP